MLRKLAVLTVGVLPIVLAVLALGPEQWVSALGAWTNLFLEHRYAVMVAISIALFLRWLMLELGRAFPISSLAHVDMGVGEQDSEDMISGIPITAHKRLTRRLKQLARTGPGRAHVIRIWLATGETIIWKDYIEHFFQILRPRANFDVRILMIDPDSTMINACGHQDWAGQVRESCRRLEGIRDRYRHKHATLSWRTYQCPPMIRAVLLNEEYLLFGFMTWFSEPEGGQLHNQNRSYIYLSQGQRGAREFIDFVKNWFDHEWNQGREISSRPDDDKARGDAPR